MAPSTIPYDGPSRYEIMHLILRFNLAHHDIDQILIHGITTDDVAKVKSLQTFDQERNLKNTALDSDLDTLIKDLESIRKVGNTEEMGKIEWGRIAQAVKRLGDLVEFNKKKFAGRKAKDEARENERKIQLARQQRAEREMREAEEMSNAEKTKLAEKQAREVKNKRERELAAQKAKDKESAEREKKAALKSPARLEVPVNAARPISLGHQNRPKSPNVHFQPQNPNNQNRPMSPNKPSNLNRPMSPTKPNHQYRPMSPNKPANQNRPMSPRNQQPTSPNKPNNHNQPASPKNNDAPKDPGKKLQKNRPKLSTEIKEERLQKAHAVGLALASEVRKFD
jgi:hypothetical protein